MTTDTRPKEVRRARDARPKATFVIAGMTKGAGMIHPNMATMLCLVTTDAPITRAAGASRPCARRWRTALT